MRANGDAIYSTRPWKVFGEGPTQTPVGHLSDLGFTGFTAEDIRFTQAKDGSALYVILFGWPKNQSIMVCSLKPDRGTMKTVGFY